MIGQGWGKGVTRLEALVIINAMKRIAALSLWLGWGTGGFGMASDFVALEVEAQPLGANAARVIEAFDYLGARPFSAEEVATIREAIAKRDAEAIQRALHPHVLFEIHLNPESRVKVARGGLGKPVLQQGGYTPVLIRIDNRAGVTAPLRIASPQAGKVYAGTSILSMKRQERPDLLENENTEKRSDRFLEVAMFRDQPMTPNLSGLEVEYAIALLSSTESGKREATIAFDVGDGTQDIGFRGETPVLFEVRPAIEVALAIRDHDGRPTTARLVFEDEYGRVYPAQAKRLAPDLFFQKQIYRSDGETVRLPPGRFTVQSSRGPEYRVRTEEIEIAADGTNRLEFALERWVDPMAHGFYGGDHHIHASGCAHYQFPTVGIDPGHVFPHVKGEGLNVGCVLTWGPGFEHQSQFFGQTANPVSEPLTLIKYDLEISGFGSAPLGHVCLLNLKDQVYPGTEGTQGWPSWTVPPMRWCKEQGGVAGYAHSASGLHVEPEAEARRLLEKRDADGDGAISRDEAGDQLFPQAFTAIDGAGDKDGKLSGLELQASLERAATELPNLAIPGMNGVGAMEIAVTAVEGLCDFISAMDTARIQEWNTWYHLMNCGLAVKVSGETDFPCMSGTRVGQGRVYVQLGDGVEVVDYAAWCRGLAEGKSYVSDGYAHALEFTVEGTAPGFGEVKRAEPGTITVATTVAFAPETPIGVHHGTVDPPLGRAKVGDSVILHVGKQDGVVEGGTRRVEIVVNGEVAASQEVPADGEAHDLEFEIPVTESSWVALRHFPQLHTNPVEVLVGGRPVRASEDSARWCVEMIEKLWENRGQRIHESERDAAATSYEKAKAYYREVAREAAAVERP